jgi:hypothetical protein
MRAATPTLVRAVLVLSLVPTIARAQAKIVVGPNVHVSAGQADLFHNEVLLSASPKDPNVLVACALAGPVNMVLSQGAPSSLGDRGSLFVSTDRGRSWRAAGVAATDSVRGDNHCIIGADGRMHFVGLIMELTPSTVPGATSAGRLYTRIVVRSSSDSGRTWHEGSVEPPDIIDRQYLLIDDTGGRYNGRIYLSGSTGVMSLDSTRMRTNYLALWRSLDGGKTFEHPLLTTSADTLVGGLQSWNVVMLSDGTVVFPFFEWLRGGSPTPSAQIGTTSTNRIRVITSRDGGASFGRAQQVARFSLTNPSRYAWAHTPTISAAADRSTGGPFRDRLYVAWFQSRDSTQGRATDIMVAYSPDGGRNWSDPVRVNDDPGVLDSTRWAPHVMPTIAVNKDGVVGLMWYDRRDNPNDPGYSVRFSASLDGGATWSPSVRLSEKPMTFTAGERPTFWTNSRTPAPRGPFPATVSAEVRFNDWLDGGHTAGLAADAGGRFHAVWVDNRTGLHQLWSASIDVTGRVAPSGGEMVAGLEDVGSKVELAIGSTTYDDKAHTVTMQVRLRNNSRDTLRAPIRVLVAQLSSHFGVPHIVGADNDRDGVGALWDFTALVPPGGLPPKGESQPRTLTFQLERAVGYERFVWARRQSAIRFDARVFAAKAKP